MSQDDELIGRLRAHERQCLDEAKRARSARLRGSRSRVPRRRSGNVGHGERSTGAEWRPKAVLDALRTVPESRAATRIVADALGVSPKVVLPKLKELQKSGAVRREGGVTTPVWAIA